MKMHRIAAACVLLAAGSALAQTSVYRWTDKDGKVHFSDAPPPADAKDASQRSMGGGGTEVEFPYAVQQAMKKNPVMLYTAPSCGEPCNSAREMLSTRGVPFGERNVATNVAAQETLTKLAGGLSVPTMTLGARTLKGFQPEDWTEALTGAGYPTTRLPGQAPTKGSSEPPPANPQ